MKVIIIPSLPLPDLLGEGVGRLIVYINHHLCCLSAFFTGCIASWTLSLLCCRWSWGRTRRWALGVHYQWRGTQGSWAGRSWGRSWWCIPCRVCRRVWSIREPHRRGHSCATERPRSIGRCQSPPGCAWSGLYRSSSNHHRFPSWTSCWTRNCAECSWSGSTICNLCSLYRKNWMRPANLIRFHPVTATLNSHLQR